VSYVPIARWGLFSMPVKQDEQQQIGIWDRQTQIDASLKHVQK